MKGFKNEGKVGRGLSPLHSSAGSELGLGTTLPQQCTLASSLAGIQD